MVIYYASVLVHLDYLVSPGYAFLKHQKSVSSVGKLNSFIGVSTDIYQGFIAEQICFYDLGAMGVSSEEGDDILTFPHCAVKILRVLYEIEVVGAQEYPFSFMIFSYATREAPLCR